MGRLFLLGLVALGAALYFPDTRAQLLDVAAPYVEPLVRPIKVSSTKEELRQISVDLAGSERLYGKMPRDAGAFQNWLHNQYATEDNTQDAWGGSYLYQLWPDSFAISSAGPDLTERTDDDLQVVRPRQSRRRRR